jgi:hypothetical protein
MATKQQIKAINLYRVLMFESRHRLETINFILEGGTRLSSGIVRELCYLQLRMLCETIAVGCLVAHGDIVEARIKNFEKEWSADKMFKRLENLNPHFFPQQMVINGAAHSVTANTNPNALKKEEMLTLYGACGDFLHRGTLKKVLQSEPLAYFRLNVPDIVAWAQKIEDLLGSHLIPLSDRAILICVLRDSGSNMDTTVKRIELKPVNPSGGSPSV